MAIEITVSTEHLTGISLEPETHTPPGFFSKKMGDFWVIQ
jgi:hypothetical protein